MIFIAVDDEPIVLSVLTRVLAEVEPSSDIHSFGSARKVLAALEGGLRPDVAFLDIEMFGMNGLELAKHIRDVSNKTKIVFVTGYPQYALEAYRLHARGYLLKPVSIKKVRAELEELKSPPLQDYGRIHVQTFGNFEIFADGKPLHFKHSKTKELLAFLIDRRGSAVNTSELCAVLWEQKPDSRSVRSHLRTLIADLNHTLSDAGAEEILIKKRNSFSIDCQQLDCDLYDFLRRETYAINSYNGEYMSQYSWAEMTLATLEQQE